MVTVWSGRAKVELKKAYDRIARDSPANAIKVRDTLIDLTLQLENFPEKYLLDPYRTNNDGTWRAFEKYNYPCREPLYEVWDFVSFCHTTPQSWLVMSQ